MTHQRVPNRLTYRCGTRVYSRLLIISQQLNLSITSVLNLMVSRWGGQMAAEAHAWNRMFNEATLVADQMLTWLDENPGRNGKEFMTECIKMMMGEPSELSGWHVTPKDVRAQAIEKNDAD